MSEQLRRQVPTALAPLVIMVTAHDRELIALTQGRLQPVLDAMLSKPVTASVLFDTVTELRLATRRQAEGTPLVPTPASALVVDARLDMAEPGGANGSNGIAPEDSHLRRLLARRAGDERETRRLEHPAGRYPGSAQGGRPDL